ncbi:MAG: hypothetical protein ABJB74_12730 [Gemmatimonas sp.]
MQVLSGKLTGALAAILSLAQVAGAQPSIPGRATSATVAQVAGAQPSIPVRETTAVEATSSAAFGNIFGVRELANGRVLVNDGTHRQLVVVDAALANGRVVLDSTSDGTNSYGPKAAPLIPFPGDSSLFVDGGSGTLLVIDRTGAISHVLSAPKTSDLRYLAGGASAVDRNGNIVYRGANSPKASVPTTNGQPGRPPLILQTADSAPIIRANFETRLIDTVVRIKIQNGSTLSMQQDANGKMTSKMIVNPTINVDEWAVLADGTIAIVRGHDYHVDLIFPDRRSLSSPKLSFDWKPLTDADKQHIIDSARTAQLKVDADNKAAAVARGEKLSPDGNQMLAVKAGSMIANATGLSGGKDGIGPPSRLAQVTAPELVFVPLSEMADYFPSIRPGAAKADLDGNLWVLPTTSAQSKHGELVYDIINNKGELYQRMRMPDGRSVAGFGRNGVLYLMYKDGIAGWRLERTKIKGSLSPVGLRHAPTYRAFEVGEGCWVHGWSKGFHEET